MIDDERVRQRLRFAYSRGMGEAATARFAGISVSTWRDWRSKARQGTAEVAEGGPREGKSIAKKYLPYVSLIDSLEEARAEGEFALADGINKTAVLGGEIRKKEILELYVLDETSGQMKKVQERTRQISETIPPDWKAASWILKSRYGWSEDGGSDETEDEDVIATKTFEQHAQERVGQAIQAQMLFQKFPNPNGGPDEQA